MNREYAVAEFRHMEPLDNRTYDTEEAARITMNQWAMPVWVISRVCSDWEVS